MGQTEDWLNECGFEKLTYKTQYFETRPLKETGRELAPDIGTMRISWLYVPCGTMTIMAQQLQMENEQSK